MTPTIYYDTEFSNSSEKHLGLVCASWQVDEEEPESMWLYNDADAQCHWAKRMEDYRDAGYVFVSYLASAECRALLAAGTDPMLMDHIDLYAEWRCLKMKNNKHSYGRYPRRKPGIGGGGLEYGHGYSFPPSLNPKDNIGKDCTEVGNGLVACAYHLLGVNLDAKHKDEMRDLILLQKPTYTTEEQVAIMEYCESDIIHLPKIREIITEEMCRNFRLTTAQYHEIAVNRAKYCGPAMARVEYNGLPFDLDSANNLSRNVAKARIAMLASYSAKVELPFYKKEKPTRKVFAGKWTEKYSLFEEYIRSKPQYANWPLTDSGNLSRDNTDLKQYDSDPNIAAYRQVRKTLKGLESYDPNSSSAKKSGIIMDSVGRDSRLRTLFGVMGTQTGRNAPRARRFVLAQGRWARSLIVPPEGEVVVAIDWKSQENAIQAILSGDNTLWESYESGDPYLHFGKQIGMIPSDGTKKTHSFERTICKLVVLGLSYGMGSESLANRLTIATGRRWTKQQAAKVVSQHKKTYRTYWRWVASLGREYERNGFLMLKDGFALNGNCTRKTSINNFPVQGTGGVCLRQATIYAIEDGVPVFAPLHDALYACGPGSVKYLDDGTVVPDAQAKQLADSLSAAMSRACVEILGTDIGQDIDYHDGGHPWIEEGAEEMYEALSPFFTERISAEEHRLSELVQFYG